MTFLEQVALSFAKIEPLFGQKMPLFDYFAKSGSIFAKVALCCAFRTNIEPLPFDWLNDRHCMQATSILEWGGGHLSVIDHSAVKWCEVQCVLKLLAWQQARMLK